MNILVCIKRVPATAGQITLTPDGQDIDTRYLGFTISPHEECAVEEAVRMIEAHGGITTVLTLGPEAGHGTVRGQAESGWETEEVSRPAVLTVKEGLNLPRYPSLPGRLKAKKKEIGRIKPQWQGGGLEKIRLKLPVQAEHTVEILG